jgi:hypothetical protein
MNAIGQIPDSVQRDFALTRVRQLGFVHFLGPNGSYILLSLTFSML